MSGTKAGFAKAKAAMIAKWGEEGYHEHYRKMGMKGGAASGKGGFYNNPELARRAGSIGGKRSKRGPNKKKETDGRDKGVA